MRITYFFRKQIDGYYSIEGLFENIINVVTNSFEIKIFKCKNINGVLRRLYDCFRAVFNQSEINHITGDVHYLSLFLSKNKTILTIHDCNHLQKKFRGVKKIIFELFWFKLPVKRSKYITVISEYSKNQLISILGYTPENLTIIPNCYSQLFKTQHKQFDANCPNILQIGTAWNKNFDKVVEAIKDINCKFTIIGRLSDLQKNLLNRFNICYENFFDLKEEEIIDKYVKCDIVVFVSIYEGFGMPIIEAQAVGRPVITSNISPMKEVAGAAACLVNPNNIGEIRNAITKIIRDPDYRNRLIASGLDNKQEYNIQAIANKYQELYNKVAKDN